MCFQLMASNFPESVTLQRCVHQRPDIFLITYVRITRLLHNALRLVSSLLPLLESRTILTISE